MITIAAPIPARPPLTAPTEPNPPVGPTDRLAFDGISWETYEMLRRDLDAANDHKRLTYDSGCLEIEMPTILHEVLAAMTVQLIQHFCFKAGIPFASFGSTTWKRQASAKGLEADGCFYIQNLKRVGQLSSIDLDTAPPPDLAIESEVTRPLLPKLPVYAALGVPEIWHLQENAVQFLRLAGGEYAAIDRSDALPAFTPPLLMSFLDQRKTEDDFAVLTRFKIEVLDLWKP